MPIQSKQQPPYYEQGTPKTVTLSNAQIKALPTTPIEIIPAPGLNKIVLINWVLLKLNWTADYTNITGTNIISAISTSNNGYLTALQENQSDVTGLLANGQTTIALLFPITTSYIDTGIINDNILLKSLNNTGNYTGGDNANTLTIISNYSIIKL